MGSDARSLPHSPSPSPSPQSTAAPQGAVPPPSQGWGPPPAPHKPTVVAAPPAPQSSPGHSLHIPCPLQVPCPGHNPPTCPRNGPALTGAQEHARRAKTQGQDKLQKMKPALTPPWAVATGATGLPTGCPPSLSHTLGFNVQMEMAQQTDPAQLSARKRRPGRRSRASGEFLGTSRAPAARCRGQELANDALDLPQPPQQRSASRKSRADLAKPLPKLSTCRARSRKAPG